MGQKPNIWLWELSCKFFFKKFPVMRLTILDYVVYPPPPEPQMVRWCSIMPREVRVHTSSWFLDTYWKWLKEATLAVDDYPYDGLDFQGDPDTILPLGDDFDERGKKIDFYIF